MLDGSGNPRLYIQGMDNGVYVYLRSGGSWGSWSPVHGGGLTESGPAAVLDGSSVRLVIRGMDNGIWSVVP